jgi:hypothetical protein
MDGQSWPSNKSLEKKLIFILFGANKNLEQFETMIKNNIPSFDTTHIFKMLKTLGSKTSP